MKYLKVIHEHTVLLRLMAVLSRQKLVQQYSATNQLLKLTPIFTIDSQDDSHPIEVRTQARSLIE